MIAFLSASKGVSPQRLREHGEEVLFFVYREIPIDENSLANKTLLVTFFFAIPETAKNSCSTKMCL